MPTPLGGRTTWSLDAKCLLREGIAHPMGEPMLSLSFNAKRTIVAVAGLISLACAGNWYFEWSVFGRFDKTAMILSFAFLGAVIHFVGPTLKEVENYRRDNPDP